MQGRARFDVVTQTQELRNATLGIQDAFALHFGGVGGEHGRHMAVGQCLHDALGRNACDRLEASFGAERHRQAAFLRVPRALVNGAAANVVAVFGQGWPSG